VIFVTIGTTRPFDRLLRALGPLHDEELVVQCGDSAARPAGATCVTFLTYDELADHIRSARVVIAHAGVGTIMTALANGKRPIVVPRRASFGEAADDHQVELARRLAASGLVTLVEDPAALAGVLREADPELDAARSESSGLASELRAYMEAAIATGSRTSRRASSSSRDEVLRS